MKNYREFKNYLHNEVKITKEEIREIIKDEVRRQIQNLINQSFGTFDEKSIRDSIVDNLIGTSKFRKREYLNY